ncbi:MAG TPA: glycerol-3-phosphate acyltransferase [bacterium]|nr:glycerol-3-phosphate acyltransferase [bacterium]HOG43595.1 glycerol-3-phosphate acyltransferase [bacterium]HPY14589.1 glycerol-3-phosphate acyltransferase [bacterium]HQB09317.1 glycerol-3-phosphate acyltransferase [bacterium]HQM84433.1 glycerol-3-phosphate acyltransferase [bacterium]
MNINRFFFLRKFSPAFSNYLHKYIFRIIFKKADPEIPDLDLLKETPPDKKIVTVYISGRKSRIEQFLLCGFMIDNKITVPTHSFGPKTIFFRKHRELWIMLLSLIKKTMLKEMQIESLYIPVDSPEELAIDPVFIKIFHKIKFKEARVIPVITLWNKDLDRKSRSEWIEKYIGKYNLWSTSRELLLLLIKRRKLTLRIEHPVVTPIDSTPEVFIRKLYKRMEDSKLNVVGASLKNWLDLKNDALLDLDLETDGERKQALKIMDSMAGKYSPVLAEIYTSATGRLFKTVFSRFHYSDDEIKLLRRLCAMQGANMILVPTHKSYFDYLILNYVLYKEKVTVPLVASGDNLDFFPLSMILRKMGAFFIKRTMKDDNLYRDVLKSYLKQVISAGYNIEFFIEGGRSRSGMVRSPRMGMLKMLSETAKSTSRKLYVVPVSITYEKLKEIEEYKKERTGEKTPESDNFFQRLRNLFKVNYGPVYIRFARPVYLGSKFSAETAYRIAEIQEKSSVISFSSIFSTLFLSFSELSSSQIVERMEFINSELQKLSYIQTSTSLDNLDVNCSKLLRKLVKKGDIRLVPPRKEFFSLSPEAVSEFSFYKNSVAFAFAPFFCLLFEGSQTHPFISEYLEIAIMGYNRQLKPETAVNTADYPEWFVILLKKFFFEKFVLLKILIEAMKNRSDLFGKTVTHTELVEKLFPHLTAEIQNVSKDQLFELIFFLEKKSVLTNNLTDFNSDLADKFISEADGVVKLLTEEKS